MIPYGRQSISQEDIDCVAEVLRSDWLTQGPWVERFEENLAETCGARYAVAVANGTAALHVACLAAGVLPGDTVAVPTMTFAATANSALYCGAEPLLVDIDSATLNVSPSSLEKVCCEREIKAIVPVHFAGLPCDIEQISTVARKSGALVIEDACHALGARWCHSSGSWRKIGDCSNSDMVCFSFHPVKHITTGEGGAILTNREDLYERLKLFRTHGITKDKSRLEHNEGPWYYEMQELGYNYRISDFQCALGWSQLNHLKAWVARRREIAARYRLAFAGLPYISMQIEDSDRESSYHLFVIQVPYRKLFFEKLRDSGVGAQVHYIPIHFHPYYRDRFGYAPGSFPNAEKYYSEAVSLPIFPAMTDNDVDRVIESVKEIGCALQLSTASAIAR
jgi:perosamine synthetase